LLASCNLSSSRASRWGAAGRVFLRSRCLRFFPSDPDLLGTLTGSPGHVKALACAACYEAFHALLARHAACNAQGPHSRHVSTSGRSPPSEDDDAPGFELKGGPPGSVRWAVMMPASLSMRNGHIYAFSLSLCAPHLRPLGRCCHSLPHEEFMQR